MLAHGLVQSYLSPLSRYSIAVLGIRLTLPVLVAALYFAIMPLTLLMVGIDGATMTYVAVVTFVCGVIAGYFRELTGSMLPAIMVHALFNVLGDVLGRVWP